MNIRKPKQHSFVRALTAGVMAIAASVGIAGAANANSYTMKISTPTINELQHEWAQMYKELLEKKTDNKIAVQIFPASQLGPIASVIEGVQLGSIEATLTPYEFFAGVDRRYQTPGMPGLYSTMQEAYDKLHSPKVRETLMSLGETKGLVGLSSIVYGPQIFVSKTPINTLADFQGKKIRVLASEIEVEAVKSLGAAPVPMPLTEVSSALQQGAIEGANNLYDVVVPQKMYTFAPNVVETDLWFTVVHATVSEAWLKQLPDDLRQAVIDTAKELEPTIFQHQLNRQQKALDAWLENGGKVTKLSEEDSRVAHQKATDATAAYLEAHPALRETYELIGNAGTE